MELFRIHTKTALILLILVFNLIISGVSSPARAGEDPDELFNYSFAVWLGSGYYRVKDSDKRFAVLRVPAAFTLRPADIEKPAVIDRLGFRLLLPAAVGYEEETDTDFSFGAVALVPGLEIQIPVNNYWTLKPFAQLGAGKDTAGGDLRYIYGGGARSLISLPWKKFIFSIGNSLVMAEDRDATSKNSRGFSLFNAGLDVRHPTNFTVFSRQLDVSVFFVANFFRNRVDILSDEGETDRINNLYDVGLTFGFSESISIWKVDLDRVGIDYRWGDKGFRGIGFNLGFPF
jgi:hypothetical protein